MYHSRVYLRFISLRMRSEPLCTGRWMCLHTLSCEAMTRSVSSLMSFGWLVVKRTRMSGNVSATRARSCGKLSEASFCLALSSVVSIHSDVSFFIFGSSLK